MSIEAEVQNNTKGIASLNQATADLKARADRVEDKIPGDASQSNKLADKQWVKDVTGLTGPDAGKTVRAVAAEETAKLLDGAPEAYDTLKEVAAYIASNQSAAATMVNNIASNRAAIEKLKPVFSQCTPTVANGKVTIAPKVNAANYVDGMVEIAEKGTPWNLEVTYDVTIPGAFITNDSGEIVFDKATWEAHYTAEFHEKSSSGDYDIKVELNARYVEGALEIGVPVVTITRKSDGAQETFTNGVNGDWNIGSGYISFGSWEHIPILGTFSAQFYGHIDAPDTSSGTSLFNFSIAWNEIQPYTYQISPDQARLVYWDGPNAYWGADYTGWAIVPPVDYDEYVSTTLFLDYVGEWNIPAFRDGGLPLYLANTEKTATSLTHWEEVFSTQLTINATRDIKPGKNLELVKTVDADSTTPTKYSLTLTTDATTTDEAGTVDVSWKLVDSSGKEVAAEFIETSNGAMKLAPGRTTWEVSEIKPRVFLVDRAPAGTNA